MARDTQSQKHQVTYRTYDNREVTRESIEAVFQKLESRRRYRELWEKARSWVIAGVIAIVLILVFIAYIYWKLHHW